MAKTLNSTIKCLLLQMIVVFFSVSVFADGGGRSKKKNETADSMELSNNAMNAYYLFQDSVNKVMQYEKGHIYLSSGNATLNVPVGFKFINAVQGKFILSKVWGNPNRENVLGIILPESSTPFTDSSFAFVVSYDPMGYVKDNDAKEINYDDMMTEMQNSEAEENKKRVAAGYESMHIVGWAQKPFYDEQRKVLYWAKSIRFGDEESNTLNYDVRILGRSGILSLNAVASMNELSLVKKHVDKVLSMAQFTPGNTYADFKAGTDNVALYTIGGLVAGKVLAKVGFFALIMKFGKIIVAALIGVFYMVRKKLTGTGRSNGINSSTTVVSE